jgi:ABC-2 type transport system permease protein
MWPLRLTLARLRPFSSAAAVKLTVTAALFLLFLYGDFALFHRLFGGIAKIEAATPFFALGLLRNVLALSFVAAVVILFSSAMTSAIGAFFTDLDLDTYHAAPRSKLCIVLARWSKTFAQSATIIYVFSIPIFVAFAVQYRLGARFYAEAMINLALLLTMPVTLGSLVIVVLVRYFPVQRVHQIVASMAILVITVAVMGFRMSRPERLFAEITTDDLARVLRTIELPSIDRYPGTALADLMVARAEGRPASSIATRIVILAGVPFAVFLIVATRVYFRAFVRARESMAPAALGAGMFTDVADRLLARLDSPTRAMLSKEIRTLSRDVAQWSQLFLMAALLFLYLYNIRMLPLGGDARATIVAYANLGMAGFIIAAICLRFAYPSISTEGRAFWMLQTAPISYRRLLASKVLVYTLPLTLLALLLTAFTNVLLHANAVVWIFTLIGALLLAVTLVSLGVGLGAIAPNFGAENPLQVGLSLGGFGYMGAALAYVVAVMLLMARPIVQYLFWRVLGVETEFVVSAVPILCVLALSIALIVLPLLIAEKRLAALSESR